MNYNLVRSNRRTIGLLINREGQLVVRAPKRVDVSDIERFIRQKQDWIIKHQQNAQVRKQHQKQYIEGERFLYLGNEHPLRLTNETSSGLIFYNGFRLPKNKQHKAPELFKTWYVNQAKDLLPRRVNYWAAKMGLKYRSIKITSAKSRWGSCSSSGNINFSWRLVLAPLEVLDYVVIHELAHLVYQNHSKSFWKLVASYVPAYKSAKKSLNALGKYSSM